MVKEGFFNQYNNTYFFKLFLERVLVKDPQWIWKNTITLDNEYKRMYKLILLLEWKLWLYTIQCKFVFIIFHFQPTGSPIEMAFSAFKREYQAENHQAKLHHSKMISAMVIEKFTKQFIKNIFRKAVENYYEFLNREDILV